MQSFLDDIRQLSACGDYDAALELLLLWLEDHPGDPAARLLQAEICFAGKRDYAAVGRFLSDFAHEESEALNSLRAQCADYAWKLVDEGRERLRRRFPAEAIDYFQNATALVPTDPAIPLAAGLGLLRIQPERDPNAPYSPFDDARRRLNPASLAAEVEKFFRLVIERTHPNERPYEVAATGLVRAWLEGGRVMSEALTLLTPIPNPEPTTRDLLADLCERIGALTLEIVANLLHMDAPAEADRLIKLCRSVKFLHPRLWLYEAELLAAQPDEALAAYKKALRKTIPPLKPDAARALMLAIEAVQVACPYCGKTNDPTVRACSYCESALLRRSLLIDAYADAPDAALAQIGIAEMLARRGEIHAALEHWQIAVDFLPGDHAAIKPLRLMYERLMGANQPHGDQPAWKALQILGAKDIPASLVTQVSRVNETCPEDWLMLPVTKRAALVRKLITEGQLRLAQETISAAFADQPQRKTAVTLRALLDEAIRRKVGTLATEVERLVSAGNYGNAITLASNALDLRRAARLYLARGQARLASGADLAALDDFFAADTHADTDTERSAARKAAALVLEQRWNVSGARTMLDMLPPGDTDMLRSRARLERRERGEPVVMTERVSDAVLEDSLVRREQPPYVNGYFALALREVGMVQGEDVRKLINANTEFVRVLGALRDVMGGAIFVLRTIARPHPQVPERGSLTVTLLVRVSSGDEAQCKALALQLWTDIHSILPLGQESIYIFEPVVDEDELRLLRAPIEFSHAAEIVRREVDSGVYTPYAAGTLDLHNLYWNLLRQSAPSMISIHLKPTHLLPWERGASFETAHPPNPGEARDEVVAHNSAAIAFVKLREKLQRVQMHNSLNAAYVVRIYAAGSAGTSQLLPEMAAAALFEPGGCEIMRGDTPETFDVITRNLSSLDVESWEGGGQERLRYLVGEGEAAQVFRLPIPNAEGVPGMTRLEGKPVVPPAGMPDEGMRLGVSVARIKGVPLPITQAQDDRRRHLYVVGKTGMGKSTLLMTLILQDIEAGRGVFLLDPHGDLCGDVLARIPASRAEDVILLDPSDAERPIGLNILDAETEADQHRIINEFIGLLIRLYDPHNQAVVGPIFQQNVRNAMLAAMALPDGTLIDVYRLLSDAQYVRRVLPHVKDPLVKNYWQEIAARVDTGASSAWKAELLPYLLSKFSRFVEDSTLRRMIGQPRSSIRWGRVMDEGKILLVNLAKGRIGQENAQFIGSLVLGSVLQAAFQRGEIPAARRRDFYLYIDEVQNYTSPMLATMLSEGRKFGVVLTIANQFLHQLDGGIREAVFGNVGSTVAFRVGTQDASALAPEFYPVFSPADLINLPQFTACVKLLIDGVAARPFTMRTLPAMVAPDYTRAAHIRDLSRQRYGTDIASVQAEILKKF